jgi:phosphohistidine phosphatase
MKLYIVRHGIAFPHGAPGIKDDDRPLTKEGIAKMKKAAKGLRKIKYIPNLIISSPLPRAQQTAEILAKALGNVELKISKSLLPSGSRQPLYRQLGVYGKKLDSLMLVGHQPSLGEIAGEISSGSQDSFIELEKGGACVIELKSLGESPRGTLVSLLPPSVLRKIASN